MLNAIYLAVQRMLVWLAGGAVILMMTLIALSVLSKNLLGTPIPLTSIIVSHYFMILIAFLPLGFAQLRGQHITVDIAYMTMPRRARHAIRILATIVTCICALLIAWQAFLEALKQARVGTVLVESGVDVPVWISVFVLPIGFLFFAVAALITLRQNQE